MFVETVTYSAAFVFGFLSFFSPCILPLIPAYFTFITGFSLEELTESNDSDIRKKVFFSTLLFVLGFSAVFVLLGASASYLGGLIDNYRKEIIILGGVVVILFGLFLTGSIRIKAFELEKRFHIKNKPVHFLGAFVVGMAFAAGWTPCVGPVLGSIMSIAATKESVGQGILLLSLYSAGLAVPFLLLSFFINYLLVFIKKAKAIIKYINILTGCFLVIAGLFLLWYGIKI